MPQVFRLREISGSPVDNSSSGPRGGGLPKAPESRRVGRMAVNEMRALLERHGRIVQEVDGGNDRGEDLRVTFAVRWIPGRQSRRRARQP
ncbi:hypothetical protein GCM10010319_09020 [Streptomyces blastmyceticus]|uniref:Uncharacterized protein n=1 Tax=Streptomyces blastmyceticus TaxID=68180 RepID=A0ABN0WF09_9ACTN